MNEKLSKKDKEMLIANSMKAVRDGESKKAFLKNTKFIIDGMVSNNYDLEEENFELKQQLQAYKDKEDKLREFLENEPNDLYSTISTKKYWVIDILEILNEGGKE